MEPQVPIEVEKPSPVARADSYATTSSEGSLFWAKKGQTSCLVQPSTLSLPVPGQEPSVTVVSFKPNDPSNPYNWSTQTKTLILLAATLTTSITFVPSTLPSNLIPPIAEIFGVPATGPNSVLPASMYLAGFVFGPLVFAPLSEAPRVGRRWALVAGALGFLVFSIAGAVVNPDGSGWAAFLGTRFGLGVFASPPASVFGGVVADLFEGEVLRGRVMMIWSAATFIGPLAAPILAGYASPVLGWRNVFWVAAILAAVGLATTLLLPETLASTILRKKAARLNREGHDKAKRFIAPSDLVEEKPWTTYKTTLGRPWRLLFCEMIISITCVYLGFVYAVFYMLVQIFPAIFRGVYGFSAGMSGILFTIMGFGTFVACFILWWYDSLALRLSDRHPDKREEYLRLPLACVSGPVFAVSMLWLGWSSRPEIHFLVPLASTIPYGLTYHLIFMAMINYVVDAYGIYSASALAALSMTRSLAGTIIPLAVEDMLAALGIAWSCTILAAVSAVLAVVPFGFIAYGEKIRAASRFSAELKPALDLEAGVL
ncbi:MFS general substrate transporter [Canariomyces notabilis]|uniref:MFS general substrate transporter n=1 Tax=Canariomyces notabilis TaxID=2074819 RepID=A0AAN6TI24_9PEZI|nr:MFS general substrate transporter [Canariomyces arenarius]